MMRYILLLFGFAFTLANEETCSEDQVPDLNGAWVCNDDWLVETKEPQSDHYEPKKWSLFFKLPEFYAVSKIRVTSSCRSDNAYLLRLSASVWDERFEKRDDVMLKDVQDTLWIPIHVEGYFVSHMSQEYSGFATRAPFWKIDIETVGMNADCRPKFMFFARAGIQAFQYNVAEPKFFRTSFRSRRRRSIEEAPTGHTCSEVTALRDDVASRFDINTTFYKKYTSAYGTPVLSSAEVDDRALQRACYVLRIMMAGRKVVRDHMYHNRGKVAIVGRNQSVLMLPEMKDNQKWKGRGLFLGTTTIVSEEHMLCEKEDYVPSQDLFVHEAAHSVHLIAGVTGFPHIDGRLQKAYESAKSQGLWNNTYANTNRKEYFAEAVQSYFGVQRDGGVGGDGIQNNINTKKELKHHDPALYKIIKKIFPCKNTIIPRCDDVSQRKGLKQKIKMNCGDGSLSKHSFVCLDEHIFCQYWAEIGECDANPDYMTVNCKRSCRTCSKTKATAQPTTTVSTTAAGTRRKRCFDKHKHCADWVRIGECQRNAGYMLSLCRKSCNACTN